MKTIPAPTAAHDNLRAMLNEMKAHPAFVEIAAESDRQWYQYREQCENAGKPDPVRRWTFEELVELPDTMLVERSGDIQKAHRVFMAIADNLELTERLVEIRQHPAYSQLFGNVRETLDKEPDMSDAQERRNLRNTLDFADELLGSATNELEIVRKHALEANRWFSDDSYGEKYQDLAVYSTVSQVRMPEQFREELGIGETITALDVVEMVKGESPKLNHPVVRRAAAYALKKFFKATGLANSDKDILEWIRELNTIIHRGSEQTPSRNGGNTGTPQGEFKGSGSRSKASAKKSTAKSAEARAEVAKRTADKPYVKTGAANPQGPEDSAAKAARGRVVPHSGLTAKERNTRGKK